MKFAINYSPQAEKLWRAGAIQVDLFKCPDWPDLVEKVGELHAVYVHCSLQAGRGRLQSADIDLLRTWLDQTDTLVINTHFAVGAADFPSPRAVTAEAVIKRAVRDLEALSAQIPVENIVIENIPSPDPGWNDDMLLEVVDPAVISEVVRRSGCGLLLDIAHAIRACEGTGRGDVRAYLNAMPVHALRELHVVGILPEPDEHGVRQDHFAMTESDWKVTEWAVNQIRQGKWRQPDTLAFEYGGVGEQFAWRSDEAVIAEQAPRLRQLAKSV